MIELVNKQFRRFIKLNCSIEMSLSELLEEIREIYIYGPESETEYEEDGFEPVGEVAQEALTAP